MPAFQKSRDLRIAKQGLEIAASVPSHRLRMQKQQRCSECGMREEFQHIDLWRSSLSTLLSSLQVVIQSTCR